MKKILKYPYILLLTAILQACISEYFPSGISESPEILVVDGVITNGETVIKLSRGIALDEAFGVGNYVNNASLYIETDGGHLSQQALITEEGKYVFGNVALMPDSLYRLRIHLQDDIFVSEFLAPLQTPEIDSITWNKSASGEPINIYVHTKNDNDKSRYYRWTFNEIWEFTSPLYANGKIDKTGIVLYDEREGPYNERYYCWQRNNSKDLIVESTIKLSDNEVRYKKIQEIPASNKKLSVLYYLDVKQFHLRKNAFDYFENLQKNIESMGSIFAPIPSEMHGNISCITRDIPAIGFVDVATSTTKSIYISRSDNLYEQPGRSCDVFLEYTPGYLPYFYDPQAGFSYAPANCIDCVRAGGTKDKPAFWPNNHF